MSNRITATNVDFTESDLPVAPIGVTRMRRRGASLEASTDGSEYESVGGGGAIYPGDLDYSGVSDSSATLLSWLTAPPIDQGAEIVLRPGTVKVDPSVLVIAERKGITLRGAGPSSTILDLGVAAGHGLVFDHTYDCRVADLSIRSASKRPSGSAIRVVGGHPDYPIGVGTLTNFHCDRVDFYKQCTGVEMFDADAGEPGGCWNVYVSDSLYYDGADDAVPFLIASPRGGVHVLRYVFIHCPTLPDATHRPAVGLMITGTNDFTVNRFSQVLCKSGLIIAPGAGSIVRAGNLSQCYFDSNNTYGVRIAPTGGAVCDQIKFVDTWSSSNIHNISLSGTGVDRVSFYGGQCYRASQWGAIVDGATRSRIDGIDFGGANSGGIWVTANAARTKIVNNDVGVAYGSGVPAKGIQIDAGCTKTIYGGNDFSNTTTPVTDGGTDSLDMGNVV